MHGGYRAEWLASLVMIFEAPMYQKGVGEFGNNSDVLYNVWLWPS